MKSLGTRLAILISSVILVLVVMVALWMDKKLTQAIEQQGIEQVDVHAQTLLGSLKTLMLNGNGILAREWLDRLHGVAGIEDIEVIRRDGKPAFNDLNTVNQVNEYLGQPRFQRNKHSISDGQVPVEPVLFDNALTGKTTYDTSHPGMITVLMPIQADVECLACHGYDTSMLRGVLKLSILTQSTDARIGEMKTLIWFGAILLVCILAISLWVSLRVSVIRPIRILRSAIMSAGKGDRSAQIPITRKDELGELAFVFNQMQIGLAAGETRIRAVTDNIVDGVVTITNGGLIDTINPAVEHIFGYSESELIGMSVDMLIPPSDIADERDTFLLEDFDNGRKKVIVGVAREIFGLKKNGVVFPMDLAVSEMHLGDEYYYVGILRDITGRKARIAALHYQAMHDALTDLPNRSLLLDRLQQAIRSAERSDNSLSLLLLDLDRFKEVNDTLGHHVGDKLLQQIAQRLKQVFRESDTVARLGGDEFCLLLPTATIEQAMLIAKKVILAVEKTLYIEGHSLSVGASIGVASFPVHGDNPLMLLQRADVAMYVAKRSNRGFTVYDASVDQNSLRQLAISSELKNAIENNQLVLYYQPKVDLRTNRLSGVEALIRWRHPKHGLLLPDEFIPLAEQSGLIKPLTIWVLHHALAECQRCIDNGHDIRVSINLSMANLSDLSFADEILAILNQHSISSGRLKLEVTETALMEEPENVIKALHRLNAMGLRISIDDFGIGYSSLTYLQQLPVSELKIDKSFGQSLISDPNSVVIVRSTIDLAHKLGLRVVAEGVENKETLDLLEKLGCDAVQGFYLGKPMPMSKMLERVIEHGWEDAPEIMM
ncbi:MAG: EAL domain-containing protein [Gammaproteobacteria bacterium]|nr:EAL domain-containing protein [Gammaproteobacteria bacterium]